jgi:hypothetical protein
MFTAGVSTEESDKSLILSSRFIKSAGLLMNYFLSLFLMELYTKGTEVITIRKITIYPR